MTDMDRQLQETLKRIVDENGTGVLLENDGRRAVAFVADYLPRAKKERTLLKIVLDTGIAGKIHRDIVVRKQEPILCRKKYIMRIREDLSIEQEAAEFIVDCIFYAFGLDGGQSLSDRSRGAGEDQVFEDRRAFEADWASGDDWADEKDQLAEDCREDEDYGRSGNSQTDEDYRMDEERRTEVGRQNIRREKKPDTEPSPKKGKGSAARLIAAGVLVALGLLIGSFQYRITGFLLYSLGFSHFIPGSKLQRYVIALGAGLLIAGVIFAAVHVAGCLRKRRHSSH